MLETVKADISQLNDKSFSQYFAEYVMTIQDINILLEFEFLHVRNLLTIQQLEHIICHECEELIKL